MQSVPGNREASLFNHSLSLCVGAHDGDTRSLEGATVSLSNACHKSPDLITPVFVNSSDAFQMESPGLLTHVECPDHTTQLFAMQVGSPGFSVQVECPDLPMQAECPGLTAKVESPFLSTAQALDMAKNVSMSVPASFVNASLKVGSNKETVSTSVSVQTVARRRRAVRIAAVFPGDGRGGDHQNGGGHREEERGDNQKEGGGHQEERGDHQKEGGGHQEERGDHQEERGDHQKEEGGDCQKEKGGDPARFPEQHDSKLARYQKEGVELTQCQEDRVKLMMCEKEGVELTQCQEDCAEATWCPQVGVEPTMCQLEELSWCQREGRAAHIRLQEGSTVSVDPQDLQSAQYKMLQGSGIDCGTGEDTLILPNLFSALPELESDSSVCVSSVPDPSLLHSYSSCKSSFCLSVGSAPDLLDQPNGREEEEPSNSRGEEEEGSRDVSLQDKSNDQPPSLLQDYCTRVEVESGMFSTSQSCTCELLPALYAPAMYSSESPAQPNQLDWSFSPVHHTDGMSMEPMWNVRCGGPGMGDCGSLEGSGVGVESDALSPGHRGVALENSVPPTRDGCCIPLQPRPPPEGVGNCGGATGGRGAESAALGDLKRTATKLQVSVSCQVGFDK